MNTFFKLYLALTAVAAVILLALTLTGCADAGWYNMSDSWCDAHPQAPNYRCPGHTYNGRGNTP